MWVAPERKSEKDKEMAKVTFIMGRDQYGNTYHDLGKHPRKALLDRIGRSHADRMYQDTKSAGTVCTGYIIGGCWITLYEVTPKYMRA